MNVRVSVLRGGRGEGGVWKVQMEIAADRERKPENYVEKKMYARENFFVWSRRKQWE